VRLPALLALAVLFLVSGATTLVYEVAWTRRLLLVLGSTAVASVVVLSAFLGGLGLGGLLGGRVADRSTRPLRLYGVLELLAAGWALLVPLLLDLVEGPFLRALGGLVPAARTALRAGLAWLIVAPGAALLGATLPALLRHAVRGRDAGLPTALLYGANTVGAVGGALWAGWVGIFSLGVMGSSRAAAAVAGAVGLVALLLGSTRRALLPRAEPESAVAPVPRAALAATAVCGFVGLGLEAAGVRVLVFFVEGFTASFSAMLAAFLLGIGVGSLLLGPALARRVRPARAIAVLLLLAGAAAAALAAGLPRFEDLLDGVRGWAYSRHEPAAGLRLAALAGSLVLFFPPALLLGATFPLAIRWAASRGASVGRASGRVYLWNSVGSALAPLAFLAVLPLEGPYAAFASVAALAIALGLGGVVGSLRTSPGWRVAGFATAAFVAAFALPTARDLATPEALVRASRVLEAPPGGAERVLREVRVDATTTASLVLTRTAERLLYTDEFQAAATGPSYQYMRMLGHLPALLASSQENALNIAFGTGTTAGALAAHAGVRRLEIVEVSRAVLALAPRFEQANRGVLGDPRVVLRVEDGRQALAIHAPDLDLITLEPLMPYTPAALPFYTREFYELARARLREGGVLCQWVPIHAMPLDVYAALLATFFEVFPEGSLWFFEQSTVLLGRNGGEVPGAETVRARAAEVAREMSVGGMGTPPTLGAAYVASGRRVLERVRAAPPGPLALERVTDERPFPEAYPLPRAGLVTPYARDVLGFLEHLAANDDPAPPELAFLPTEALPMLRGAAKTSLSARRLEADALYRLALAGGTDPVSALRRQEGLVLLQDAVRVYEEAMAATRHGDPSLVRRAVRAKRQFLGILARGRFAEARVARAAGDETTARAKGEDALRIARQAYALGGADAIGTERPAAALLLGEALVRVGRCREAERVLTDAASRWPATPRTRDLLAAVRNRRLGRDDLTRGLPGAAELLADFVPCKDDDLGPAGGPLDRLARAVALASPSRMRSEAQALRVLVAERKLPPDRIADEVEGFESPGGLEAEAVLAALLRALRPDHPTLPAMLRSPEAARRRVAATEAARGGVEALRVEDAFLDALRSDDPATRAALAQALALDTTPWARARLLDLLADPDVAVRKAAFSALATRLPDDLRSSFDATADESARSAAIERLRASLGAR
jgi:spermidine synthase